MPLGEKKHTNKKNMDCLSVLASEKKKLGTIKPKDPYPWIRFLEEFLAGFFSRTVTFLNLSYEISILPIPAGVNMFTLWKPNSRILKN